MEKFSVRYLDLKDCKVQYIVCDNIELFMQKYYAIKKELALDGYYIPHICDKLYPFASKGITKKRFIQELYRLVDIYQRLNFPMSQLAKIKRHKFEENC